MDTPRSVHSRSSLVLLVGTNVVLDVILAREPWAAEAVGVLEAAARGVARGYIAGHAVTTVHYIVERATTRVIASTVVSDLLELLGVVPLERGDFQRALAMGLGDYEDAVQVAAALRVGADYLVTRNGPDFRGTPVATRTPGEVLGLLGVTAGGAG